MKLFKRGLLAGPAFLVGILLFNQTAWAEKSYNIMHMDTEFSMDAVSPLVDKLTNLGSKAALIELNSPGGAGNAMQELKVAMRDEGHVDTYVKHMAASAAADTWLMGHRRFVESNATILFHKARLGGMTEKEIVTRLIIDPSSEDLNAMYSVIHILNEGQLDLFNDVIAQSHGKLTRESIKHDLFHDFDMDIFVSGKQLFDMGIATDLGSPNKEDYKDHLFG